LLIDYGEPLFASLKYIGLAMRAVGKSSRRVAETLTLCI
jgi:hypothetical protein